MSEFSYADGVAGEGDAPEWFKADKYANVSEQAKAYVEAEKQLKSLSDKAHQFNQTEKELNDLRVRLGSFTGAPETYELSLPEGVEIDPEDPMIARAQEWAKGLNLNQEGYNSALAMYSEIRMAEQKAMEDSLVELRSKIDNFDGRTKNINDFLTANKMEALADVIQTEEELVQFESLLELAGKASISVDGDGDPIPTEEEINKLMFEKDEHGRTIYGRDKARTEQVRKMWERRVGKGMHRQEFG